LLRNTVRHSTIQSTALAVPDDVGTHQAVGTGADAGSGVRRWRCSPRGLRRWLFLSEEPAAREKQDQNTDGRDSFHLCSFHDLRDGEEVVATGCGCFAPGWACSALLCGRDSESPGLAPTARLALRVFAPRRPWASIVRCPRRLIVATTFRAAQGCWAPGYLEFALRRQCLGEPVS
jgi:hypothetical protein